jgi:hypothetical protein
MELELKRLSVLRVSHIQKFLTNKERIRGFRPSSKRVVNQHLFLEYADYDRYPMMESRRHSVIAKRCTLQERNDFLNQRDTDMWAS